MIMYFQTAKWLKQTIMMASVPEHLRICPLSAAGPLERGYPQASSHKDPTAPVHLLRETKRVGLLRGITL